jgi:transcription elongation regulator 1
VLQVAWVDAEARLQDDPRWDGLFALDNSVKRRLFDEHRMSLARKRTDAFAAAFDAAHGMTIGTLWDEARALVCTDPRFVRFSEDDTEREEEYTRYVRGRTERARKEYRDLLKETRSITHTTLNEVNDEETGEARKRELLSILGRDSRYGELDSLGEAREELLNEYLVEVQRKGAPLPPTADPIMAKSHP